MARTRGKSHPNIDRGNSDFDISNAFTAGVTYNLPSPELNRIAHAALGGWSVDSFIFARTAPPVDLVGAIEFADGIALYPRPDVLPGVPLVLYGAQYPGGKAFNPAAFTAPPTGQQGDFGRNVLRGFGAWQADVAFQRQFRLTDKSSASLPRRVLQPLQPSKLRPSQQQHNRRTLRPINADAGEQSGFRRR